MAGPLKLGVQLRSLKLPLKPGIQAAAQLGFSGIEIDVREELRPVDLSQTGLRQFRKMIDDLQLRIHGVSFYTRRGLTDPDQLERRVEALKEALSFAYKLGAPSVITHLGAIPTDETSAAWLTLVQVLTDLTQHSQRAGAWLAVRTGTESGPDLLKLLQALPEGSMGVCFDAAGLLLRGHNVHDALNALGPRISYVYARDAVRDSTAGRGYDVPLGRGSVDFTEVLGALEDFNYRGFLTVERENSPDPRFEVEQARRFLINLQEG